LRTWNLNTNRELRTWKREQQRQDLTFNFRWQVIRAPDTVSS